jgi:Adenine deaminase (EC 3.5.4.2)
MPPYTDEECEWVDGDGYVLVPGYIEPHVHPFQIYNPQSFAEYAARRGTTVLVCDNLPLILVADDKEGLAFLCEMQDSPATFYWWARFDSQSAMEEESCRFTNGSVRSWLDHDLVVQGGELTGWPIVMAGNDLMLHWMQIAKKWGKRVEGHFPGASEKTLVKMKLMGTDGDHEAMTGKEVAERIQHGYMATLRHSSIRPDLPKLLREILPYGPDIYSRLMLTTDGSPPAFYEKGVVDCLLRIAIEEGIPPADAYVMASLNPATYFRMDHLHGSIATGRVADINFLREENDPVPVSVIAKGKWVKRDGDPVPITRRTEWGKYGLGPLKIDWDLNPDELHDSIPVGISLVNAVVTKPYSSSGSEDRMRKEDSDECILILVDRQGKWRVNTTVRGFARRLGGLCTSFTGTGDILLVGKNTDDLLLAFRRMKCMGGGIVIFENGVLLYELSLPIGGFASDGSMEELMEREKELKAILESRGYSHGDPILSFLFFTSTHLPYLRVTPKGLYDVMKKKVLFPSVMR